MNLMEDVSLSFVYLHFHHFWFYTPKTFCFMLILFVRRSELKEAVWELLPLQLVKGCASLLK